MSPTTALSPHRRQPVFGGHGNLRRRFAAVVGPGRSSGEVALIGFWLGLLAVAAAAYALSAAVPAEGDPTPLPLAWVEEDGAIQVVPAGRSVVWTNIGQQPHTITAADGAFDSGVLAPGESWAHVFSAPGAYAAYCALHPSRPWVVIVERRAPSRGVQVPGFEDFRDSQVPSP